MAIRDYLIVHYHEVGLKGGNRSLFERALVRNIARATSDLAALKPRRLPGRILVDLPAGVEADAVAAREIVDPEKFRNGISEIIDGVVVCLNASTWSKQAPAANSRK